VGGASSTCLANLSWGNGTFWSHSRTNGAEIPVFREVDRHSGFYEFHSWANCCQVSRRELFANITSLTLELEMALFQSLPKINDREDRKKDHVQTDSFAVFESSHSVITEQ